MENYFFLKNYVISEGAVSHNVLYYQPLPITRYRVRFYAIVITNIVSTVFNEYNLLPWVLDKHNLSNSLKR